MVQHLILILIDRVSNQRLSISNNRVIWRIIFLIHPRISSKSPVSLINRVSNQRPLDLRQPCQTIESSAGRKQPRAPNTTVYECICYHEQPNDLPRGAAGDYAARRARRERGRRRGLGVLNAGKTATVPMLMPGA